MNPTVPQQSATAPAPATPTPAPAPQVTSATPKSSKNLIIYPIALAALVIGVVLGYFIFNTLPGNKSNSSSNIQVNQSTGEIALPADAVQIQACSDHRGALYVKPADIPVGPVYMVNNGKVIGIEYMLGKDQFLGGTSFKDLAGEGIKVDHVNIGLLSQGHEGYPLPHYHVDMYTVSKDVEQSIVCNPTSATATSSAALNATSSASPATSSAAKK